MKFNDGKTFSAYVRSNLHMISVGFYQKGVVCRMYWLYPTNLVCLASERFICLYGWDPYL